ncbi:MAG: acireductone synthase [Cyanobacteriota bacterium]
MTITHLLLDIEGTTCPVSFVAEVLFPYARAAIPTFLETHQHNPEIQQLAKEVESAWLLDRDPQAAALRQQCKDLNETTRVAPYLQHLIDRDIKLTPLKDLQGRIWRSGYASGALVAPLYSDVAAALRRWHEQKLVLAVYSSGSIGAQQLLYRYSVNGDLSPLFSYWFDTRTGPKQESGSYEAIAQRMGVACEHLLFISDAWAECQAANTCGMRVLFSDRPGNPEHGAGSFEKISDYATLEVR